MAAMMKRTNRSKRVPVRTRRDRGNRVRETGTGRRAGRWLLLTAFLVALIWFVGNQAVARVTALPVFTVNRVAVEGAERLDRSRIIETAGIALGINIFRVDLKRASDRLRKEFAAKDFTLYRRLPGTIVIRVRERKPVALVNVGKLIGVDADGVLLPHIGESMADSLPIITGIGGDESNLADPAVRNRLLAGLGLLDSIACRCPGVQKRISEVNVSSLSGLGISLINDGLEVIIGENGWGYKLPQLERVINRVSGRMDSVKTVDMRFIGRNAGKIFLKKNASGVRKPEKNAP